MEERRKVPRQRVLKAGTICFSRGAAVDCRVRNMSPAGACLEVVSQVGIPADFVLLIEHDRLRAECSVKWRNSTRLGVEFSQAAQAS